MRHCPWHTEGGRVNTPRIPREISLCQNEQGEKWEEAAALVSLLLPPIKCPGLRGVQCKVLVGGGAQQQRKAARQQRSGLYLQQCPLSPHLHHPSSNCPTLLLQPEGPPAPHKGALETKTPPQQWADRTHPPPHRGPVLPQQNTTFIESCLAAPSMGSMVLRMDVRKGTMPNTARRGASQRPTATPTPPHNLSSLCTAWGAWWSNWDPRNRDANLRTSECASRGAGPPPTIGDGEAGECVHGAGMRQEPRLELAQQLLHHAADEPPPHRHQDAASGLLPIRDQLLSPKTSTDTLTKGGRPHPP